MCIMKDRNVYTSINTNDNDAYQLETNGEYLHQLNETKKR